MFKLLRKNSGQGIFVQYSMTILMVLGVIAAMTTYVKRALQGRIYDTKRFMYRTANKAYENPNNNLYGTLYGSYEPYYVNRSFQRVVDTVTTERTLGVQGSSGIYEKVYEPGGETRTTGTSILKPAKMAE